MHAFSELAYRCTHFSLRAVNEGIETATQALTETEQTIYVKGLQALNLQKMIHAVGLFSVFEAHLQQSLNCKNGFKEAESILDQAGQQALKDEFHNFYLAINALKHGDGASYNKLVANISSLNFVVDTPTTPTYEEGDVTGVVGLVRVDDAFIENCLRVIDKVSDCIATQRPDYSG